MGIQRIEQLAVSPSQASFLTSLSKRTIQKLMSRGAIPYRKVGRRTLIPFSALKEFLQKDYVGSKTPAREVAPRKSLGRGISPGPANQKGIFDNAK